MEVCFLLRVLIVYDTKYGNTKLVAEKIAEGTRKVEEIETDVVDVKKVDLKNIDSYVAILIGAPNHIGSPSRTIMKFIDELGKRQLKPKDSAVFDTHMGNDLKAAEKLEKRIREKVPALKLITPGLPTKVNGMRGPVAEGELPSAIEFGQKIAAELKTRSHAP
jgi:menaquinone-dependent protoporphyrinogen IX oxidase